jgi:hypothetical protein
VIQAVIRQFAVAAAKGQPRSQRLLADLVRWVEGDRRELNLEFLKTMIEYKQYWDQELDRRERLGHAGPEPLPHPDDILIDFGYRRGDLQRAQDQRAEGCSGGDDCTQGGARSGCQNP